VSIIIVNTMIYYYKLVNINLFWIDVIFKYGSINIHGIQR